MGLPGESEWRAQQENRALSGVVSCWVGLVEKKEMQKSAVFFMKYKLVGCLALLFSCKKTMAHHGYLDKQNQNSIFFPYKVESIYTR